MCTSLHSSARQCDWKWVGGPLLCFLSLYTSMLLGAEMIFFFTLWSHNTKNSMNLSLGRFLFLKIFHNFTRFYKLKPLSCLVCFLVCFLKRGGVGEFKQTNIRAFSNVGNISEFQFNSFWNVSIAGFAWSWLLVFQSWCGVIVGHHHPYDCAVIISSLPELSWLWRDYPASGS